MTEAGAGGLLPLSLPLLGLVVALPLFLVLATAYAKIAIVLGLLRHALGTPRVPPDGVLLALALLLTLLAVGPTLEQSLRLAGPLEQALSSTEALQQAASRSVAPVDAFLAAHAAPRHRELIVQTTSELRGAAGPAPARLVLLAAFALTELEQAFRLGLLIFLPFLVVDLVVGSSLVAAGLGGIPVERVALPLKLMLFVLVDGWPQLLRGLLLGYAA